MNAASIAATRGILAAGAAAIVLAAPLSRASEPAALAEGFTCCNLHYNGDWISDTNRNLNPMIPAGAPIKLLSFGRYRAHVLIDGREMRLGQDYGREQALIAAGYPPTHQTASVESTVWDLWSTRTDRYQVVWSESGVIKEINGPY